MDRHADKLIAGLATRQHGLVTRAQLVDAGLAPHLVRHRRRAGWLQPVHRGVYRVGPLRAPRLREMAAVLASGRGAVVSHRSAAPFWQLLPAPGLAAPVELIVRAGDRRRRPGIRAYRLGPLDRKEMTTVDGIPVTSPPRTLLDLASVVSRRDLERALAQAYRDHRTGPAQLLSQVARRPTQRGAMRLKALLECGDSPELTRSEAEERLLGLIVEAELPRPETNVQVGGYEVDCLWRERGVIVEVDGFAHHASKGQFENDRLRDARLAAGGYQVIRVTWRQIVGKPLATMVRLGQALLRAAGPTLDAGARQPARAGPKVTGRRGTRGT